MITSARPIALVGLPGAGKTAVGKALATRLAVPFIDLDEHIEAEAGARVPEVFAREGEDGFREREARALRSTEGGRAVVACGGGVVTRAENRERLKAGFWTAWLEVAPAEAARRLADERGARPLLREDDLGATLTRLARERGGWYREVAASRFDTTDRSPETVAEAVAAAYRHGVPA